MGEMYIVATWYTRSLLGVTRNIIANALQGSIAFVSQLLMAEQATQHISCQSNFSYINFTMLVIQKVAENWVLVSCDRLSLHLLTDGIKETRSNPVPLNYIAKRLCKQTCYYCNCSHMTSSTEVQLEKVHFPQFTVQSYVLTFNMLMWCKVNETCQL